MSVTTNCVLHQNLENYGIVTRGIHDIWQGKRGLWEKNLKNSKKNIDSRAKMALLGQSVSPSETAARTQSERNDHAAL
jgi:hypothetical protein